LILEKEIIEFDHQKILIAEKPNIEKDNNPKSIEILEKENNDLKKEILQLKTKVKELQNEKSQILENQLFVLQEFNQLIEGNLIFRII